MDTVLLRIMKKRISLVNYRDKTTYKLFIKDGFGGGKRINYNLRNWFSKEDFPRICQKLHISASSRPSQLSLRDWLSIFNEIYPTTPSPNFI